MLTLPSPLGTKLFTNIADRQVPVRKARIRGIRCPWMNSRLSKAMCQRDYLHRKTIKFNSSQLWSRYKKLKDYVSKEMKNCKAEYYSNPISENESNPSGWPMRLSKFTMAFKSVILTKTNKQTNKHHSRGNQKEDLCSFACHISSTKKGGPDLTL